MKMRDIVRRAGRSLKQAKARTLLTSLAIAVGAFTLTLALAAGQGSREYAADLIESNIDPRSLFIVKDESVFGEGGQPSGGLQEYNPDATEGNFGTQIEQLTQADLEALQARDDLTDVVPTYEIRADFLRFGDNDQQYVAEVSVYNPDVLAEASAGQLPELGRQIADDEVVVPDSFAETLETSADELIGQTLTVTVSKPTTPPTEEEINRILTTEGPDGLRQLTSGETREVTLRIVALTTQSDVALTSSSAIQISSNQARDLAEYTTEGTDNFQKYFGVTAKATNGQSPEDVKAALAADGYAAQTAQDLQNLLFTVVNVLQGIVAGFGILALIASVFGIINTQYISVLERTQQIGLMKALGTRRRDISRLFRYEAAWIGFLGGVLGAGSAWIVGTLANPWISQQLSLGDDTYLLIFNWLPVIGLVALLMIIAVLAGYFPARKAARLDPIEALRTE